MTIDDGRLRDWSSLSEDEQVAIRVEYGCYLDTLPPSCNMDTKLERFQRWLLENKAVHYSPGQ